MNKKTLPILLILALLSVTIIALIPNVQAVEYCNFSSFTPAQTSESGNSLGGQYLGAGETFNASATGQVLEASVAMKKTGAPLFTIRAYIYPVGTGTFPTNAKPSDLPQSVTPLGISFNVVNQDQVSDSTFEYEEFYFDGANCTLTQNTTYLIYFRVETCSNIGFPPIMQVGRASNYGGGNYVYCNNWAGNDWQTDANNDLLFTVEGNTTPTTSESTDDGGLWGDGVTRIFNTVFPIALIAVPAVIGWRFARAWGFFAGLNIAIIFLNVFELLPLWSVIIIIVIDGLLLFAKAGFRE